jgi:quercetin dioxygenase-like cupin family protein
MTSPVSVTAVDRGQANPPANPGYFQGSVHMQELYRPDRDGEESELVAVFFETRARTRPHMHDSNQVLQVVAGRCLLVTETARRIMEAGQIAIVPRGTWHWHGATGDGPMCHISIKLPGRTHWDVPPRDWESG